MFSFQQTYTKCKGVGCIVESKCSKCSGVGSVKGYKTVTVEIARGIEEGNILRMTGKGEDGVLQGICL